MQTNPDLYVTCPGGCGHDLGVDYDVSPAEPRTSTYPGCAAHICSVTIVEQTCSCQLDDKTLRESVEAHLIDEAPFDDSEDHFDPWDDDYLMTLQGDVPW